MVWLDIDAHSILLFYVYVNMCTLDFSLEIGTKRKGHGITEMPNAADL